MSHITNYEIGLGTVTSVSAGTNLSDSGTASNPILDLDGEITLTTVNATTFDTNVAAAGLTLSGTTLSADGTDTDININISSKGAGYVLIDDLVLSSELEVTSGGTGAITLTDHGVLLGSGVDPISETAVGDTGTILQGNTAADPTWSTATYPSTSNLGDVLISTADNVIETVSGATTAGYVLTANGVGVAPTFQATSAAGVQTLTAGTNLSNSGTADDPILDLDDEITLTTVNATTFDTNIAAAGLTLSGTTISADGTDTDIGITLTPKGAGDITVTIGDVNLTSGNVVLPASSSTAGQVTIGGTVALQMFGTHNFFAGGAGNLTLTDASYNVGIGKYALDSLTTGDYNIAIGYNALTTATTMLQAVAVGYYAGAGLAGWDSGSYDVDCVCVGNYTMGSRSDNGNIIRSVAIGNYALNKASQNAANAVAIGHSAAKSLQGNHQNNTVIGCYAFDAAEGELYHEGSLTPRQNTIIGASAASNISGDDITYNTIIGYGAGGTYTTTESSNILLGCSGVIGDNNVIRIGNDGSSDNQQDSTYIAGIYGVTPSSTINVALVDSDGQLGSEAQLDVTRGGTGRSILTAYSVLLGSGTSAVSTVASVGTADQVLTSNGAGAAPSWQDAPSSGISWSAITSDQTAAIDNGYICNKAGLLSLALPTVCAVGKTVRVTGMNTALGIKVTQAAGQIIHFGTSSTTTGATGYISSTGIYDSVELVCSVENTEFIAVSSMGNWTIA